MNAFLVPRRSDGGQRDRVWNWLRSRLEQVGWPIYEGHHDEGPFSCAAAINRAANQGPWDFAVITGSDLIVPTCQVRAAVGKASRTGKLTHAHDHYYYLSQEATERVLKGDQPETWMAEWHEPKIGNGPVVVTRDLWERVGGYDEGFVGWGYEDVAFRFLCEREAGEAWVPGPNFHLWHPVTPDATNEGASPENRQRWLDYLEGRR